MLCSKLQKFYKTFKFFFDETFQRINMLETCVPIEYPVNVYKDVYDACQAAEYDTLADLSEAGDWVEMDKFIEEHHHLINSSKLRCRHEILDAHNDDNRAFLWTPLHWAAWHDSAGI